ncbi:MAG: tripartite tricarboxylate transporter substrate binding protein BugD [Betaproteobacteria bacterium]|nr:tripartite tricarboxylate transporter substrate binding protein BugD [Betaproteobacteria bacterium]
MMRKTIGVTSVLLGLAAAGGALAQSYPTKMINMVVPYAAGGPTDTVARVMGQAMTKPLGQTVVVENRPSAGGIIGPEMVKNARPDGYTILIHHIGMATTPALYRSLRFKPIEDFEPIGLINDVPMTLVARGNFPAKDFKEFLAYVKANKDKVTYANAGIGAASHLCGMLFMNAIQINMLTVPYKGTAPAMNDLLGGQVDFMCDQTTNTTTQIKSGKVKVYAVTSKKRVPSLPEVPTLDELGLKGFDVGIWHALYAPKGTPKAVIDKLAAALQEGIKDDTVKKRFADLGAEAVPLDKANPAALAAHLRTEINKWGPIIKRAGVYAD